MEGFAVNIWTRHDAGEHIVTDTRYPGRYKPSGKRTDGQACRVLRFRDGKLVSFQ